MLLLRIFPILWFVLAAALPLAHHTTPYHWLLVSVGFAAAVSGSLLYHFSLFSAAGLVLLGQYVFSSFFWHLGFSSSLTALWGGIMLLVFWDMSYLSCAAAANQEGDRKLHVGYFIKDTLLRCGAAVAVGGLVLGTGQLSGITLPGELYILLLLSALSLLLTGLVLLRRTFPDPDKEASS